MSSFFKQIFKRSNSNSIDECSKCSVITSCKKTCDNCNKRLCFKCHENYKLCKECDSQYNHWFTKIQRARTEKLNKLYKKSITYTVIYNSLYTDEEILEFVKEEFGC